MSKLPLLNAGNIVVQKWMTAAEKLLAETTIPIEYVVGFIRERLPEMKSGSPKIVASGPGDRILLLKSYTGSGKSMVPVYMHKAFFDILHKNTVTTEPKVLTTIEITEGTVSFSGLKMEETIGYQTGQFHKRPIRGIVFMTTGVLNMQLKNMSDEEIMRRYMIIIIDECHDRDVNNDMLMFLLKEFLERNYANPACPMVILMSATFEQDMFSEYFKVPKTNYIECKGLTYEVKQNFPSSSSSSSSIIETIKKTHLDNLDDLKLAEGADRDKSIRDIIVFCDTSGTIKKLATAVEALNDDPDLKDHGGLMPIFLDRINYNLGAEEYRNFKLPPSQLRYKGKPIARRVIFTTTFAETGITIDGLKYCIDTGVSLQVNFNPIFNATRIATRSVSQDMAVQRRGRVGRKAPGEWYPMYSKPLFESMMIAKYPDILKTDITELLLSIIVANYNKYLSLAPEAVKEGIKDVTDLDIMGYPSVDAFEYSLHKLTHLGFVMSNPDIAGAKQGSVIPTEMGQLASRIAKISLENARMILSGYYWGANVRDLITIAAFLEVGWKDIMEQRLNDKYQPRNPMKFAQKGQAKDKKDKKDKSKNKNKKGKKTEEDNQAEDKIERSYIITGACGMDQSGLRNILNRNGWTEADVDKVDQIDKVGLLYMENDADKKFYGVKTQISTVLNKNDSVISDKFELYKNMVEYYPETAKDHMAKSYDLSEYLKLSDDKRFAVAIVKPLGHGAYAGAGVKVVINDQELKKAADEMKKYDGALVSEYIDNPMLFNGRKFHIRALLLVRIIKQKDQSQAVSGTLWTRGTLITARLPYKHSDYDNPNIHDSHLKSTPNDLFFPEHLAEKGINTDAIFEQMNAIAQDVVGVLAHFKNLLYPEANSAVAVFGLDFMVDDQYVVRLLECNHKIGCKSAAKFPDFSPLLGPWTKEYSEFSRDYYEWFYAEGIARLIEQPDTETPKIPMLQMSGDDKSQLHFKLMWCDEFLEFLWLWYELLEVDPEDLEQWCLGAGVKYVGLLEALILRDEVIESMVSIGLNPMYFNHGNKSSSISIENVELVHLYNLPKLLQSNMYEGMEEIVKIKRCIFDGYKNNLAIWNGKSYVMAWKRLELDATESPLLNVKISDQAQKNPRYIITDSYALVDLGMPKQTMMKAGLISIMDGFVDVDEHLFDTY